MKETTKYINPFDTIVVTNLIHENDFGADYWISFIKVNTILEENEWYVLFEGGVLVRKKRSRLDSSQRLLGVKMTKFKRYYGVL